MLSIKHVALLLIIALMAINRVVFGDIRVDVPNCSVGSQVGGFVRIPQRIVTQVFRTGRDNFAQGRFKRFAF